LFWQPWDFPPPHDFPPAFQQLWAWVKFPDPLARAMPSRPARPFVVARGLEGKAAACWFGSGHSGGNVAEGADKRARFAQAGILFYNKSRNQTQRIIGSIPNWTLTVLQDTGGRFLSSAYTPTAAP
jgi:hypothetical protein